MTDTTPETVGPDTEAEGWGDDAPAVTYPEYSDRPHNHNFTISLDGRGPMVAIRAQTAVEFNARLQELEDAGTLTMVASVYSHMKAEMAIAQGLGPVSPVGPPQGAPAPVQPMPLQQSPQAQYPVGPPALPQGPAPAQWQNAGAPAPQWGGQQQQGPSPEYAQNGWYRLTVPFPKKGEFDGICSQYNLRKGRPSEPGGQYSFQKADKSWYVSPDVAGAFPQFNPVPA